jgi:hypothetical protein
MATRSLGARILWRCVQWSDDVIFLGNNNAKYAHTPKEKVTSFEVLGLISWLLAI